MYFSPWSQALGFSLRPRQKKSYWMFLMQIDLSFHWLSIDCKDSTPFDWNSLTLSVWALDNLLVHVEVSGPMASSTSSSFTLLQVQDLMLPQVILCQSEQGSNQSAWVIFPPTAWQQHGEARLLGERRSERHENKELTHVTSRSMFFVRTSPKSYMKHITIKFDCFKHHDRDRLSICLWGTCRKIIISFLVRPPQQICNGVYTHHSLFFSNAKRRFQV